MASIAIAGHEPWWAHRPRTHFLVRRLVRLVVSLAVLITLAFAMIHLIPGDPVRTALGPKAPLDLVRSRRHTLWLDRPLPNQFLHYLHGLLTGDLGTSIGSNLPVSDIISTRLPNTAQLAGLAFVVIMALSIPLGMVAAVLTRDTRRRGTELAFTSLTGLLATVPEFLLGVGLVVLFAVNLHWLPVAGKGGLQSYILPVAALSLGSIAALARIVRAETLTVLGEDYIRTARSKQLPARLLYLRHVLPNMLTGTLTIGGLLLAGLVGGTVLVENVFAWPGLGTIVVSSVAQQDYPVAQAIVLMLGATVLVINAAVDLLLGALDPRSTIGDS
jgi:ABC-type dipeptide/oligopeptide/nickel transport system permease component